ncbi:MAG: ATPase [Bacteroidetes bacterium]|nr:MAG: ATPase [Bacteroidota bacterium]
MTKPPIRIVITGPESSGKSTLTEHLATHYKTLWVAEYAREYIENLDREYNYNDILQIAKGQIARENELATKTDKFLFCDTGLIVPKIWCDVKFGKCHPWIQDIIKTHHYDLYLLCKPDIPWQADPQRENPNDRDVLFEHYLDELKTRNLLYFIVEGKEGKRLCNSIQYIEDIFRM